MALEGMAEQRMSLGRDLHDGLAPLLAGAGLTAEALRRGMPEGSPDAEEAARLASRLRNAATEVRRIAHDLQPDRDRRRRPDRADPRPRRLPHRPGHPSFTVDLDDLDDQALPATVELAVSRVALEAITNVVRHAHATHAHVSLRIGRRRVGAGGVRRRGRDRPALRQRSGHHLDARPGRSPRRHLRPLPRPTGGGTRLTARVPVPT